jgi:hypothetical protein
MQDAKIKNILSEAVNGTAPPAAPFASIEEGLRKLTDAWSGRGTTAELTQLTRE